mmetsp:Transcript_7827/g.9957  ORF Transcript_7827/g.9957 Transcript_7827/m.9957 type:complete len:507 (+) Transcript_7827:386-1906(+)
MDRKKNIVHHSKENHKKKIIVIGAGPAGLFCAKELAEQGFKVILLERGEPVEKRGADIGKLIHRRLLDPESNFCFGEGGAGTWSDGKLTTRIGRNEIWSRRVLETFVQNGASANILIAGAPHLGTDTLVRLLRNLRHYLVQQLDVHIHFRTRVTSICTDQTNTCVTGCLTVDGIRYDADALVVATGHSADEMYHALANAGAILQPKGIAVGYRIEHPQALINRITYGPSLARRVKTGRRLTDKANIEFSNASCQDKIDHSLLPVPGYRLAANGISSKGFSRSAYSFCCCPGGQIVPASTSPDLVVVNGMSFSRRDSIFANAALVATIDADDPLLFDYRNKYGALAALHFQRDAERAAAKLGGGNLVAPVARVTDFLQYKTSYRHSNIHSSYRLGVKEVPVRECYPEVIHETLATALLDHFEPSMPGFICPEAILHGVETRTSAPVQVQRDKDTLEAIGITNLFPCGEGAGHAGGIVSAAVDGIRVAHAVAEKFRIKIKEERNLATQ